MQGFHHNMLLYALPTQHRYHQPEGSAFHPAQGLRTVQQAEESSSEGQFYDENIETVEKVSEGFGLLESDLARLRRQDAL